MAYVQTREKLQMPRSGPDIKTLCSVPGLWSWSANYNMGQRIKSNIQHVTYKSRKKLLRQLHPPPECLIAQVLSLLCTKRASQACLKRCASAHTLSFSAPFKIPVFSNHIHALKTLNVSQFHIISPAPQWNDQRRSCTP